MNDNKEDIWSKDRPLNLKKISDFFNDIKFSQDDLNNKASLQKLCSIVNTDTKGVKDGEKLQEQSNIPVAKPSEVLADPPVGSKVYTQNVKQGE